MTNTLSLPAHAALSAEDAAALSALYQRGTPANTLRAWERDLAYIVRLEQFIRADVAA